MFRPKDHESQEKNTAKEGNPICNRAPGKEQLQRGGRPQTRYKLPGDA